MQRLAVRALVLAAAVAAARGLKVHDGPLETGDDCGKGFESLNEGSQKYFGTLNKALWTHPYHLQQFGVFEQELKCWYSKMLTTKCGSLGSKADARKKDLTAMCKDLKVNWLGIWDKYDDAEKEWFKKTYPNDAADNFATADYREAANTALELNKKEMLCMTAFVIDDNCVDSMYIRTS
mmetsp:Transcript_38431/g.99274  ORF Transcript_38431/g.99274 Transcript_38431/m.99274 type:complete len:179 (+) Transcript_38431:58-594(+)